MIAPTKGAIVEQLQGKVAVVTGGASGIGFGLARRAAAEGMKVAIADIEQAALDRAADELAASGAEVLAVRTDVAAEAQVLALRDRVLERFGTAHLICANAGVGGAGDAWFGPVSTWEWVVGVNLWGVVHTIRAFLPTLTAQDEGHIVTTASMAGLTAPPGMAPYTATKHAVVGLTESLHHTLVIGGSHVGVSVLCPGWVNTAILDSDRNWPEHLGEVPTAEAANAANWALFRQLAEEAVRSGMPPDEVAGLVFDAVRANRFWILTHPDMAPAALQRMTRAVSGEQPGLGLA